MTQPAGLELEAISRPVRLKRRPDFLRAGTGRKAHSALFTVQAVERPASEPTQVRIGYTVTKKVGNSVERNRIKRRLREAVRTTPDLGIKPSHDYVIVARRAVLDASFVAVVSGLEASLGKLRRPASGSQTSESRGDRRPGARRSNDRP